jgi:hypothetical protein
MATGVVFAAKAARVSYNTFRAHQRADPKFAGQVLEAEEEGVQLLYDACFDSVVNGNVEPVFWQGERVGYIRKYDSRLRIEFLRAHMPERFKSPGQAPATVNTGQQILVLDEETRHRLQAARREALMRMRSAPCSSED